MAENATTIDSLQIEIQTSSQNASQGLDDLSNSLNTLKASTNITKVLNNLGKLSERLNGLSTSIAGLKGLEKLDNLGQNLATSLAPLSTIKTTGLNKTVTTLGQLPTLINTLDGDRLGQFVNQMNQISEALKPLSDLNLNGVSQTITKLGKIPDLIKALDDTTLETFTTQMQRLATAMTPLNNNMGNIALGFQGIASVSRIAGNGVKDFSNKVLGASVSTSSLGSVLKSLKAGYMALIYGVSKAGSTIGKYVSKANDYIENMSMFSVAMGEFYDEAYDYAELVSDKLGIDMSEWTRNQAVFASMASGFGFTKEQAYELSEGLTELSYDVASFFNLASTEEAFNKMRSGFAGELEPLRALGYSLDQATLQQVAYAHGVDLAYSSMTQSQKAILRYTAIVEQSAQIGVLTANEQGKAWGDMARTLDSPANAIRRLKAAFNELSREIGNVFLPIISAITPYVYAFVKVVTEAVRSLVALLGFEYTTPDSKPIDNITGAYDEATESAKEFKNATMGFDELNVISPPESASTGNGYGADLGIDIAEVWDKSLIEQLNTKTDEIIGKFKEWLGITDEIKSWADFFDTKLGDIALVVGAIASGLAAWKIADSVTKFIDKISGLGAIGSGLSALGLLMFIDDIKDFVERVKTILEDGASLETLSSAIGAFAGAIGDALLVLGNVKTATAFFVIEGISEIVSAISGMVKDGVQWEEVHMLIDGLSSLGIAIGIMTKNWELVGISLIIEGIVGIIDNLKEVFNAIKTGDWSGVDKIELIIDAVKVLGGLAIAIGGLGKLKDVAGDSAASAKGVTDVLTEATGSGGAIGNMQTLATNLAWGVAIITEVAAAAIIFVGAIAIVGYELQAVADAWKPVLENGGTVITAIALGTGILGAVGLVVNGLGTLGKTAALNIGIGTLVLFELGVATGLFLIEIWAIGKALDEIGQAWQPVINNGETIATGIAIGTGLLVAIGLVTAALGAVSVGTAGTLPLAIAIGTAVLVELGIAFGLFVESLVDVADSLSLRLSPALDRLNALLPTLTTNMSNFVDFMGLFAEEVVEYTKNNAIAGLSATVDTIIGWFTTDPIEKLATDVERIKGQTSDLNDSLVVANAELEEAIALLTDYRTFLTTLEELTNIKFTLATDIFVNMQEVGKNLITGFELGITNNSEHAKTTMTTLGQDLQNSFKSTFNEEIMSGIAQTSLQAFIDMFYSLFTPFVTTLLVELTTLINDINTMVRNGLIDTESLFDTYISSIEGIVATGMSNIRSEVKSTMREIERAVAQAQSALASIKSMAAQAQSIANSMPSGSGGSVSAYATGGVVSSGQLFIARESGPELVGNIGGSTSVMNNEQIVQAVARGVANAVAGVMGGDSNQNINVYLDGEVVYKNQQKVAKKLGYNLGI